MNMRVLALVMVLVLDFEAVSPSNERFMNILNNIILSEGNGTTILMIMDFTHYNQMFLVDMMNKSKLSLIVFDVTWLAKYQQQHRLPMQCPSFRHLPNMTDIGPIKYVKENNIYKRTPLVTTDLKFALTILIWVSSENTDTAVFVLENDVMKCKQKVEMGLLHKDNKIIFVSKDINTTLNILETNTHLTQHPKVAVIYKLNKFFNVWNKDLYSQTNEHGMILNKVLLTSIQTGSKISSIFHEQKTFNGLTLHVLNIPLSHYVQATYLNEPRSKYKVFTERWGMAIDMLQAMQEKLDFEIEFWNPDPPYEYGNIADDGSWTGGTRMLLDHKCDFIIDWAFGFERSQVSTQIPYNYLDYETFASPLPYPVSNMWAITLPFNVVVWICIILLVPIMSSIHCLLAYVEGSLKRQKLQPWMSFGGSFWYSFGTLQGESITRSINLTAVNGLRWSIGAWMLYCLIVGVSYSSSLKSYMTSPLMIPSLNSINDIVFGPLPWKYTIYYAVEEEILASMTDPLYKKFWDNKIALYEYDTPMYDVQNGEAVRFDWLGQLKVIAATKHTTTHGKVLVNIGSEPVLSLRYQSGMFRMDAPWIDCFIDILSHISNSGLIHYWESKAFREIRSLDTNEIANTTTLDQDCHNQDGGSCPLKLEHYVGSLLLSAILLLASLVMFCIEVAFHRKQKSIN